MFRYILTIWVVLFFLCINVSADTLIFHENCNETSVDLASATPETGTSFGAEVSIGNDGSRSINTAESAIDSSSCAIATSSSDQLGSAYPISPAPTTDAYYCEFTFQDGGSVGASDMMGCMLNYIDANNHYYCAFEDDDDVTPDLHIFKVKTSSATSLNNANNQDIVDDDTVRCTIDYSGADPTITIRNVTDSIDLLTATDTSDKLTKTGGVTIWAGDIRGLDGTPEDDLGMGDFWVYEVSAGGTRRVIISKAYEFMEKKILRPISRLGGHSESGNWLSGLQGSRAEVKGKHQALQGVR